MFVCENITLVRNGTTLFSHLGFCLQEGAFLLIKGANGSGKSSLLDVLAGEIHAIEGRITLNGEPLKKSNEMMHVGHESDLRGGWSAQKHVTAWAKQYDTETLINAALHYYGLTDYKDIPAKRLSAGLRRRLMLAKLIVAPCKLWLLDEPTNFLDEEALLLTSSLIEARVKQGGIVIVATHIMSSAIDAHTLNLEDFKLPNPAP